MLPIVLFYGLISGVFAFGKQAVLYVQPFFLTSSRLPFAGCILVAFSYYTHRYTTAFTRKSIYFLGLYGITLFIGDSFRFTGMVAIPAANAALVSSTGPFVTAFSSHFLLNERLTIKKIAALILGFLSVIPLIISNLSFIPAGKTSEEIAFGYMAAFISVLGFVGSAYSLKVLTSRFKFPALFAAGVGTIIGGVVGITVSLLCETWNPLPITSLHEAFPYLMMLFIGHNIIGYSIFSYLISKYPVSLVSLGQLTLPLFTALIRYAFFGDTIPWVFCVSLVVLSCAFYIFYTETKRQLMSPCPQD
jgi:drug/metabolite transporter (DMT)-like permease